MQQWNNEIRLQLNDLPGFPPTPTGSPPGTPATDLEWILGDWIQECRLRPAAATFASLPATGNEIGDVRVSLADQAWYIWDGAAWQPMGGGGGGSVNSVGATAPLSSTGGVNPVISFPAWPANAAGALTNDGAGNLSWNADAGGTVTSVTLAASTTGLTISGGASQTITTSGTFTLGGTLAVGNGGTGTSTAFTPGSVVFAGVSGVYSQDNANLFWNDTNNRLGVGTNGPVASVDVATGQLAVPDGNAVAPALSFRDDLNTGFFSPSNDIVGVAVNGTEIARLQQSGAGSTPVLLMGTPTVLGAITVDSSDPSATAGVAMLAHGNAGTTIQESYRGGQFAGIRTRGTKASPSQVGTDDGLWNAVGAGYTATGGYNYGALITFKAEQAYTSTASGGRIEFHTTANGTDGITTLGGSTTERLRITNAGNVGIATSAPTTTLSVAEKFQVNSSGNIVKINNVATSFPASQGGANTVLTNDGSGNLSWAAPSSSSGNVDVPGYVAQEVLNAGDLVRFVNDGGTAKVQKADATNSDARLNPVGFAVAAAAIGAPVTVRVAGVADVPAALFDTAPVVGNVGQRVWCSTTSGQITLTAPIAAGDIVQRVGVLVDGSANPKVLVQIGDPVLL